MRSVALEGDAAKAKPVAIGKGHSISSLVHHARGPISSCAVVPDSRLFPGSVDFVPGSPE